MLQILVQFAGNLSERVSRKQSSLNLSIFLFFSIFLSFFLFFYRKVSEFISLRFFFAEFSVEFSFSWIFLVELHLSTFIYFHFLGSYIQEASDETNLLANFSCLYSSGPRIRTDSLNSSSKRVSRFLVPHCLGLLLPSPLRQNQVPHVVSFIFSKK